MLGCPCKIIKPFTCTTSKKSSAFRYNSVLRISSGCSCYHTKSFALLQGGKNGQFNRREWIIGKSLFKEQKNFIWTSILLWKERDSKISLSSEDSLKKTHGEKVISSPDNVKVNKYVNNQAENSAVNTSDNKSKINKGDSSKAEINGDAKSIPSNTQVFASADSVENTGPSEKIDKKVDSEPEKLKKIVLDNLVFSENKAKAPGIGNTIGGVPVIGNKVIVKPSTSNSMKIEQSENAKPDERVTQEGKKEEGVKRQVYELNLGEVNREMSLTEPGDASNAEQGRTSDEVELVKDSPQKFFEKAKSMLLKTVITAKPEDSRTTKAVSLGEPKGNININATPRRRQTVDLNRSSTERNFITPVRAMTDFLLKPSDLEGLRKTKRRSPYENDPPITVYWRKDVEAKALDVWGSKENLLKEILKRDIERRRYQQNLFTVKRRLRDYRREQGRESEIKLEQNGLLGSSGKVVLTAIAINGSNFMFKLIAWIYTGSHSMFSEAIHSLADTINQLILAYGIHKSVQRADSDHPYGYTNMRYVASLISGVGIFCVGAGLSFYHGVVGLTDPSDLPSFYWAYMILLGSLASEGATLLVAFNSIRIGARKSDMSFSEYVLRGQDPSVNVVLLEDAAAVVGVAFAGSCMGLSSYYNSHVPDALGSFLVGGLLAGVASFIIYTNVAALVGRSIPQERLDKINAELESDVMIRAIHDVKGIDIGNSLVRYKAEMDFDGGELTRSYLDKQDLNQMLEEVRKMQTIDELEEFMLRHGENIVDMMGGEIDRIELKLRVVHQKTLMENNLKYNVKRRSQMKTVDVIFVSDELVGTTIVSKKDYERLMRQKVKSEAEKLFSEKAEESVEARTAKRKAPQENDLGGKRARYVDDVELALAALENDDVEKVSHALPSTLFDEEDVSAKEMFSLESGAKGRSQSGKWNSSSGKGSKLKDSCPTPNNSNKRVIKDIEEIQKILENSDDEFSGSESDESFRLSDESLSDSEHSRSDKTFFEGYCQLRSSKKAKSPASAVKRPLKTSKLTQKRLDELVSNFQMSPAHKTSVKNLLNQTLNLFSKWDFVLQQNYNLVLYGAGSKREILGKFVERFIDVHPVIVVNGFFPDVSAKEILEKVCAVARIRMDSSDVLEKLKAKIANYDLRIYLAINNIDGIMLRSNKVQSMLSQLGKLDQVHIIASIDHINAPLIWNKSTCAEFNWIWYDSTTFLSYTEETVYEGNLLLQSTGKATLSSLRNVFNSLTKNSRGIFMIILRNQLKSKRPGISFRELYQLSRKELLISSDVGLRAQLKEFIDHLILKQKRNADGEEQFVIVIENSILKQFLEEQETHEN